jgi:hypothetical protein
MSVCPAWNCRSRGARSALLFVNYIRPEVLRKGAMPALTIVAAEAANRERDLDRGAAPGEINRMPTVLIVDPRTGGTTRGTTPASHYPIGIQDNGVVITTDQANRNREERRWVSMAEPPCPIRPFPPPHNLRKSQRAFVDVHDHSFLARHRHFRPPKFIPVTASRPVLQPFCNGRDSFGGMREHIPREGESKPVRASETDTQ